MGTQLSRRSLQWGLLGGAALAVFNLLVSPWWIR